jgi:hypothetical protein
VSRRRSSTADPVVSFGVYSMHPVASAPFIAIVANAGPGEPQTFGLSLGDAYELGKKLVGEVDALLSGASRPWDGDPRAAPFASRGPGRGGTRASAAAAPGSARARRRAPQDGYPRVRRIRPAGPVDSGA